MKHATSSIVQIILTLSLRLDCVRGKLILNCLTRFAVASADGGRETQMKLRISG